MCAPREYSRSSGVVVILPGRMVRSSRFIIGSPEFVVAVCFVALARFSLALELAIAAAVGEVGRHRTELGTGTHAFVAIREPRVVGVFVGVPAVAHGGKGSSAGEVLFSADAIFFTDEI